MTVHVAHRALNRTWTGGRQSATPGNALNSDPKILAEAASFGIDLAQLVAKVRARWRDEERDALQDMDTVVDRHGLQSDGERPF